MATELNPPNQADQTAHSAQPDQPSHPTHPSDPEQPANQNQPGKAQNQTHSTQSAKPSRTENQTQPTPPKYGHTPLPLIFQTFLFIGKTRLNGIFGGDNAFIWNTIRFILLLFIATGGWFYGYLYDAVLRADQPPFEANVLESGLHTMALMVVFLVNYVPSFRPRSEYLHTLYPVSVRFRTAVNFFGDLLNLVYVYALVFIGMMVVGGDLFGIWHGLNAALFLGMAIVLERGVKVYLEHFVPKMAVHVALTAVMGAVVLGYLSLGIPNDAYRLPGQTLLFVLITGLGLHHYITLADIAGVRRTRQVRLRRSRKTARHIALSATLLYLKRKATLFTVFMIIVSKLFVVAYALFFMKMGDNGATHDAENLRTGGFSLYYIITLMLPIIPFSYVHNNWAGFFREFWLTLRLQSGSDRLILTAWLGSLMPFLFFDLALTAILITFMNQWSLDLAVYFGLCISLFLPLGLMASIHHPRYIDRLFTMQNIAQFRNNSSAAYMLLFLVVIVVMSVLLHMGVILHAAIPVLLIAGVLSLYLPRFWNNRRHAMYDTLFSKE